MKLTNFIVAATVVIAATLNFGAQGFPRPQIKTIPRDGSRIVFTMFGYALENSVSGLLRPSPNGPGLLRTTTTIAPSIPTLGPIVTPTRLPTPSPIVTTSTIRPEVAQCIRDCPTTTEYNPVCGSNGVMYNNPGRLICARDCGINVTQIRIAPCGNIQG